MEKIRLLIADDHAIFRQGLRSILEAEGDLEVVAEAADGLAAVEQVRALAPDVVLVDLHMPLMGGLEVTRAIKRHSPRTGVVVLTAYEDEDHLVQGLEAGAAAVFLKDVPPEALVGAIRRVAVGEHPIDESLSTRPGVAARVLKRFRELERVVQEVRPLFAPLTAREMEVLENIARGRSNKEIARALGISDQTVKNHITSILRKLVVNDRTQAVVYALRQGWIKMEEV